MMISYDSTTSTTAYPTIQSLQGAGNTTASTQSAKPAAEDTVKLSATAQVAALHTNGMSVKQIAAAMGMTTQEVDTYLGITTTSSAVAGGGGGAPPPSSSSTSTNATTQSKSSTNTSTQTSKT